MHNVVCFACISSPTPGFNVNVPPRRFRRYEILASFRGCCTRSLLILAPKSLRPQRSQAAPPPCTEEILQSEPILLYVQEEEAQKNDDVQLSRTQPIIYLSVLLGAGKVDIPCLACLTHNSRFLLFTMPNCGRMVLFQRTRMLASWRSRVRGRAESPSLSTPGGHTC